MKTKVTTTYHHGNLKDALIEEALIMVHNTGVENLTLRELTKKLGASRSAVYRHYDSKDALIKALIRAGFDKLDTSIRPTMLNDKSVLDRFHDMGKAYITFALENPNIYRMIFGYEVEKQREEECDINDEESAKGFHLLIALLAEAQEKKIFKTEDPLLQATYVWANVHGLSNLCIDGHLHVSDNIEALFELSLSTMIKGLEY